MSHSVSEQAARSVKKSEKTKLAERTPEEIIKNIRDLLDAKLAVTPDDVRFLLKRFDETYAALQAAAPTVDEQPVSDVITGETMSRAEFHVRVPKHVGGTVRIISEVGDVNVVGDVKGSSDAKTE